MAKNAVLIKLEELGLEQYASALIDDQGYDDLAALDGLTLEEAGSIADDLQMKPGHKRAFVSCFGTTGNAQAEVTRKGVEPNVATPAAAAAGTPVVTVEMSAKNVNLVGAPNECVYDACCCFYNTCFIPGPNVVPECWGHTQTTYMCCTSTNLVYCLCDCTPCGLGSHSRFEQMLTDPRETVCCIWLAGEHTVTKPLCLSGGPICRESSRGWCCNRRCACPGDEDVPCMYGPCCFLKYAAPHWHRTFIVAMTLSPTQRLLCPRRCCECFPFNCAPGCLVPAVPEAEKNKPSTCACKC